MTKLKIDDDNWGDIWESAVNGLIPKDMAQDIKGRLGLALSDDKTGTERTKFGVSVQISTCFQMGPNGDVLKNQRVIDLVNNFKKAGRPVTAFALVDKPKFDSPIAKAIKQEGWRPQLNEISFLDDLKNRFLPNNPTQKDVKRLREVVIANGSGWTADESDTINRGHVGVINTSQMHGWQLD